VIVSRKVITEITYSGHANVGKELLALLMAQKEKEGSHENDSSGKAS
jgi:hypothetical protein